MRNANVAGSEHHRLQHPAQSCWEPSVPNATVA
jgi:hypothetical protein